MNSSSERINTSLGVVLSYVIFLISFIGSFFVTPKVLQYLGEEQYGLYSFSNSITSWLAIISTALVASYVRFASIAHKDGRKYEAQTNSIYLKLFGLLAILVLIVITVIVSIMIVCNIDLANYSAQDNLTIKILLFVSGINVSINISTCIFMNYCMFKKRFIFVRTVNLAVSIITYICQWVLAFFTRSIISIAIAVCVISLVSSMIMIVYAFRNLRMPIVRTNLRDNMGLVRDISVFSGFILLNTIVDQINNDVDKTILGVIVNASAVTYYTLSRSFTGYLSTIASSVSSVFVPRIHEYVAEKKHKELNELYLRISKIQMIAVNIVFWGFVSAGSEFVLLWLGEQYIKVYYYSIYCMAIYLLPYSTMSGIEIQRAYNKHKFRAVLYTVFAILNIVISVAMVTILPNEYSIFAVLSGTAFSTVVGNWIILNIYNKKVIGLQIGKIITSFVKITACGFFAFILQKIIFDTILYTAICKSMIASFLLRGALFALAFCIMICALERSLVKRLFRKIHNG